MKVAIWGSYKHGNFGDDVMAVLMARRIAALGAEPVAFCIDEKVASADGTGVATSCDELLDGAALCVMGGGAMLETGLLRWGARGYSRDLERDLFDLWRGARRRGVPVVAVSIGGDGSSRPFRLPPARHLLFGSGVVEAATVRLPSDVEMLGRMGVDAVFHPDVVLGVAGALGSGVVRPRSGEPRPLRVGVNLLERNGLPMTAALLEWVRTQPDAQLVFIHSHLPGRGRAYEVTPTVASGQIEIHRYEDPDRTVDLLANLDVLVSSKLHLGVTALVHGVPFLSYAGRAKATAFLRSCGAMQASFPPGDEARLLRALAAAAAAAAAGEPLPGFADRHTLELQIEASGHHLAFLDEACRRAGATARRQPNPGGSPA